MGEDDQTVELTIRSTSPQRLSRAVNRIAEDPSRFSVPLTSSLALAGKYPWVEITSPDIDVAVEQFESALRAEEPDVDIEFSRGRPARATAKPFPCEPFDPATWNPRGPRSTPPVRHPDEYWNDEVYEPERASLPTRWPQGVPRIPNREWMTSGGNYDHLHGLEGFSLSDLGDAALEMTDLGPYGNPRISVLVDDSGRPVAEVFTSSTPIFQAPAQAASWSYRRSPVTWTRDRLGRLLVQYPEYTDD